MNKNPYLNAVYAGAYILLLVVGIFNSQSLGIKEPNMLIPVTMLSLLVLSVSIMGYLFVLQPAMMYVDGQKKEAVNFFLKTVGTFAGICLIFLVALVLIG